MLFFIYIFKKGKGLITIIIYLLYCRHNLSFYYFQELLHNIPYFLKYILYRMNGKLVC